MSIDTLVVALAGGKGERLWPLTRDRAKPAVPFGGRYRLIDITLSNVVNSELRHAVVLVQYKAQSLIDHLNLTWNFLTRPELGEFLQTIPAQMRMSEEWYSGTADAVRQNLYHLDQYKPESVLIVSTDHIYKMDYRQMIDYHLKKGADVTVAVTKVKKEDAANRLGVIEVDNNFRIVGFEEKPNEPKPIPGDAEHCLVNMGVYFFNTNTLRKALNIDTANLDFGKHVIPTLKDAKAVYAYPFYELNKIPGYRDNKDSIGMLVKEEIERTPDSSYWSDVGDPYILWAVHMDLVRRVPLFDLYNTKWPIHSKRTINPPFKIDVDAYNNEGQLSRSIAGAGTIISGGKVISSVVFQRVFVDGAGIEESIVMDDVYIGRGAELRKTIVDKEKRS